MATLLSVSVCLFFFVFVLLTEGPQRFFEVCVGGARTSPLPVRTELQYRPGIWVPSK